MKVPIPGRCAAWASLVGILIAPALHAEEVGRSAPQQRGQIVDIVLDPQLGLLGQVVSPGGAPVANAALHLQGEGMPELQASSDDAGRFRLQLARGGVYQLSFQDQRIWVRVWTPAAAPPTCRQHIVIVHGDVLRGQSGRIPFSQVNPWLVAGVIAAAVAIPVVISNHRSDRGDGS